MHGCFHVHTHKYVQCTLQNMSHVHSKFKFRCILHPACVWKHGSTCNICFYNAAVSISWYYWLHKLPIPNLVFWFESAHFHVIALPDASYLCSSGPVLHMHLLPFHAPHTHTPLTPKTHMCRNCHHTLLAHNRFCCPSLFCHHVFYVAMWYTCLCLLFPVLASVFAPSHTYIIFKSLGEWYGPIKDEQAEAQPGDAWATAGQTCKCSSMW